MKRLLVAMALACSSLTAARGIAAAAVPVTYSLNYDPTLSPDGKRMIFLKALEGREQMFIANADGSDERLLLHDSVDIEDPAFAAPSNSLSALTARAVNIALVCASGAPPTIATAGDTSVSSRARRSTRLAATPVISSTRAGV